MALSEVQLIWENQDYSARKALEATASVVQPAFLRELGPYDSGRSKKIVVTIPGYAEHGGPVISDVAPSGRDDDDVDLMTTSATLPPGFVDLAPPEKRQAVLDVLCAGLVELADARGWSSALVEHACRKLRSGPISFHWRSKPVTSPNRKLVAQAAGEVRETGAWYRLEIHDRVTGQVLACTAEERLKGPHAREFELRSGRIRWIDNSRVCVEPKSLRGVRSGYRALFLDVPG